jgi:hypothetical protein
VPVRRAQLAVGDGRKVKLDHLERVGLGAQIVYRKVRHD